jgi:hypothetical protein
MTQSTFEHLIFDIETDGLLPAHVEPPFCMTRIHCLSIKDVATGEKRSYVDDRLFPLSREDDAALKALGHTYVGTLSEGIAMLENARTLLGHNIIDFDLPAIEMIYPNFTTNARIIDTLVMVRMCFADIKEKDFRLAARGMLAGRLIGMQGLEAWGQRLGLAKGDYKKDREDALKAIHKQQQLAAPTKEELHDYVWGAWNVPMHDYMVLDVDVNDTLWLKIDETNWSREAMKLEHEIHALMVQQERNGFYFDKVKALKLGDKLQKEYAIFAEKATDEIGRWYRPSRWHSEEEDGSGLTAEHGENKERRSWGNVDFPKRTISYSKSNAKLDGDYRKMRASTVADVPFVRVELRDFNPNSRQQIVDRLTHLYGWTPQDFTEKGNPRVDDEILRNLADDIPLARTLAEIFYYKKRIGMVVDGKNGWLKLLKKDGFIHGRVNVGGTVTGRATHSSPNISQVPGVTPLETKDYNKGLDWIVEHKDAGTFVDAHWSDKKGEWTIYVRGRKGNHGWDCRELFTVPAGYKLVGCDLSGIEFRCLANLTFAFDDGELVDTVLNGDIHQKNADLAGISRSIAKRLLYACVDMETQALTKDGWKYYHELSVGDMALTYNMEKNIQEWKPIEHLHHVTDAKLVRIEGRGIDVVCTPDHRWATTHKRMVDGKYVTVREYCRTDELTGMHRIIGNAPFLDEVGTDYVWEPDAGKYNGTWSTQVLSMGSNERGAFLAGFLNADGHFRTNGKWSLTQKYGEHLDALQAAMYLHFDERTACYAHNSNDNITAKVEVLKSREWGCQRLKITPIDSGDVWCMTTANDSFVMRRGNFVTITGNCMYGGGDAKLGSIVEPLASEGRQRSLGKQLRAKLMAAMPSLNKAIKEIHKEARKNGNTLAGLDGRRLFVRAKHAALNLRLQSDGALIAKKWCLLIDDAFYEEGWDHGVGKEYFFCSWSHDEVQIAVREECAERAAEIMADMAPIAGDHFGFNCPVAAESKIGENWAITH